MILKIENGNFDEEDINISVFKRQILSYDLLNIYYISIGKVKYYYAERKLSVFYVLGKEVVQTNHIVEDTEFYHSVREVVSVFK